jgi:mono/diheme cytochrome c family protein
MNCIHRAAIAVGVGLSLAAQAQGNASAGRQVFLQNCAVCHGPEGRGNGPGSAGLNPKPANFSDANRRATTEDKQVRIVTNGGPSEKLSPIMPPFNEALTAQQIRDVVAFIRTTFQQSETAVTPVQK